MLEHIQANAALTIEQMRPLCEMDFGYTPESVEWLEGYIERLRQSGQFADEARRNKMVSVLGSFIGECLVRYHGGVWTQHEGVWCVSFGGNNFAFPFTKVSKQMERGSEDGIGSFFRAVPLILKGQGPALVRESPGTVVGIKARKPWWRFW